MTLESRQVSSGAHALQQEAITDCDVYPQSFSTGLSLFGQESSLVRPTATDLYRHRHKTILEYFIPLLPKPMPISSHSHTLLLLRRATRTRTQSGLSPSHTSTHSIDLFVWDSPSMQGRRSWPLSPGEFLGFTQTPGRHFFL